MAKIVDPDFLIVAPTANFNLTVATGSKTFTLNANGALTASDGISAQALYSKFVELWTSSSYNRYPFPRLCYW